MTIAHLKNLFLNQNVSDTQQHIKTLMSAIMHETENNSLKIESIKEEIAAGKYHIQSRQIAAKLCETIMQLTVEAEVA